MLNIKVQRLKCYRDKKIKTEKLRNTNMLDKCRSITQYSVTVPTLESDYLCILY